MEPHAFIAEVYRRMALRNPGSSRKVPDESRVQLVMQEYERFLPRDKAAAILDIGYGDGWFLIASRKLGYTNLHGAEFGSQQKDYLTQMGVLLQSIETDIGTFLAEQPDRYDFIHMAHVIEHIPKYSLLWVVDALFRSLKKGGVVFLRTPNMEGPTANSSFYVTLGHEYGFAGSNLESLLNICGFDEINFHAPRGAGTLKGKIGDKLRSLYVHESRARHRLFGVNRGNQFGSELVVTACRGDFPPLFDCKFY